MGIADIPRDYEEFADLMDSYERETYVFDPQCRAVADSTLDLFVTFYPRPLRPLMRRFSIALLDEHLRETFGYDRPAAVVRGPGPRLAAGPRPAASASSHPAASRRCCRTPTGSGPTPAAS